MLDGVKPRWRSIWCMNKASPSSAICLWQAIKNRQPNVDRLQYWALFVILFAICVSVLWKTGIIFSSLANLLKIFNRSFVDTWGRQNSFDEEIS